MAFSQSWIRLSALSFTLLVSCLPPLLVASPVPLADSNDVDDRPTCSLKTAYFDPSLYIKQHILTLSKQAKEADLDHDSNLFGKHLFSNINPNDHCHLMKQVLDFTVKDVLPPNFESSYPSIHAVTDFLQHLQYELRGCDSDEQPHITNNLEELKNKVKELGKSAQNKAIGELRLLYQCLKDACMRKPLAVLIRKSRS